MKLYYFYSRQCKESMNSLKLIQQLGIETVCVDSENIRRRAKKIGIRFIPSIVVAKPRTILTKQDFKNFLKVYEDQVILENVKNPVDTLSETRTIKTTQPPKTPISDIVCVSTETVGLKNVDIPKEVEDAVKKAVKENSIMDKVKLLTKEREEVMNK